MRTEDGLSNVYERIRKEALRMYSSVLGDDVEDIVQDVMVRCLEKQVEWEGDPYNYLKRAIARRVRNALRDRQTRAASSAVPSPPTPTKEFLEDWLSPVALEVARRRAKGEPIKAVREALNLSQRAFQKIETEIREALEGENYGNS